MQLAQIDAAAQSTIPGHVYTLFFAFRVMVVAGFSLFYCLLWLLSIFRRRLNTLGFYIDFLRCPCLGFLQNWDGRWPSMADNPGLLKAYCRLF